MIYDKLTNLKKYKGLSKHLDTAIDFIESHDLGALSLGRNEVDGDNVFINVMEIETKDSSDVKFEVHKKYIDIHIDLKGTEALEIGDMDCNDNTPYDEAGDCYFSNTKTVNTSLLDESSFGLCFPLEPHKPGVANPKKAQLKKAVVKVLF